MIKQLFPLSDNQRSVYMACHRSPDATAYHIPLLLEVKNNWDIALLTESINELALQHPMLWLRIESHHDEPMNVVEPVKLQIEEVVIDDGSPLDDILQSKLRMPFKLNEAPLIRFYYIRDRSHHYFFVAYHHLLTDELPPFFWGELEEFYKNKRHGLLLNTTSNDKYDDYVSWQKDYIQSDKGIRDRSYWEQQLTDLSLVDYNLFSSAKGKVEKSYDYVGHDLTGVAFEAVKVLAQQLGVSAYTIFVTSLFVLINKYTGQRDVAISSIVNGRWQKHYSKSLGDFTNAVILRANVGSKSKHDFIKEIFSLVIQAIKHGNYPYARLNKFSENIISFVYHSSSAPDPQNNLLQYEVKHDVCQLPEQILNIEIIEEKQYAKIFFKYDKSVLSFSEVSLLIKNYLRMIEKMTLEPDCQISVMSMLTEDEYRSITNTMLEVSQLPEVECIHQQFEMIAATNPDETAIVFGSETISYQKLNEKANQLARYIAARYESTYKQVIPAETVIAICLPKGINAIIAMLAILKLGAVYLPLDVAYPLERIKSSLDQAEATFVIINSHLFSDIPNALYLEDAIWRLDSSNLNRTVLDRNLAYIIFTSGTTGAPNAVAIEHKGVCNLALAQGVAFGVKAATRVLQFASLAFDASVSEIWVTLLMQGTLCIPTEDDKMFGYALADFINRHQVDIATIPPSILATLTPGSISLNTLVMAGEAASEALANDWYPTVTKLINAYGPSEGTVCATMHVYQENDLPTNIGKPIKNVYTLLLDAEMNIAPVGVNAEIYIGGIGLARGYLNNSELTSKKFVANPLNDKAGLLYRTGDMGRYLPDDSIEYRGRVDSQVKIRGFRIELGEIEHVINRQQGIKQSVVTVWQADEEKKLIAFVLPSESISLDLLKKSLSLVLPKHMLPNDYVMVDSLPLTNNGKIDKTKLLAKYQDGITHIGNKQQHTLVEKFVVLCADVLKLDIAKIDLTGSFFQLGGTSLTILKFISRIRKTFDIEVSIKDVFDAGSLNQILVILQKKAKPEKSVDYMQQDLQLFSDYGTLSQGSNRQLNNILITGASGFLGLHLLQELLKQTNAHLYCFVRANDDQEARVKLEKKLYNHHDVDLSRVTVLRADLARQNFNLLPDVLDELAKNVDAIFHCGAEVNHIYSYDMLREANVLSTAQLINLAEKNKIKRIHYISTIDTVTSATVDFDSEHEPLKACHVNWGYIQSKWVSEKLLNQSRVPVTIYRPGNITGDSVFGISEPHKNHAAILLKSCIESGIAPDWDDWIEMTPVDKLSETIVKLSLAHSPAKAFYNLHNPQSLSWGAYIDEVNAAGYPIKLIEAARWKSDFLAKLPEHHPLGMFKSIYQANELEKLTLRPEMIKNSNTRQALADINCIYHHDYKALIRLYLNYFEKIAFIPQKELKLTG